LPSGKYLRLLLLHICTVAVRDANPVVHVGDTATELAEQLGADLKGPKLRELAQQWERLVNARITVSVDGGSSLAVLDARGRARSVAEWRQAIRLNTRFFASLTENAVQLEQRIVTALSESPLALDAYFWLCAAQRRNTSKAPIRVTWEDLRLRFAVGSQSPAEFRLSLSKSFDALRETDPHLVIDQSDTEVTFVRRSEDSASTSTEAAAPQQAPEPELDAQPAVTELPAEDASSALPEREQAELPLYTETENPAEPPTSPPEPGPGPVPVSKPEDIDRSAAPASSPTREKVGLRQHLTGLPQTVWLQRRNGRDNLVIEVTPGGRYDPDALTVLALEPIVLQVKGGLHRSDFERVAAWANSNRDLIEDFWDYSIDSEDEIATRVKKVPLPGWR
jgi:hypothetical protein